MERRLPMDRARPRPKNTGIELLSILLFVLALFLVVSLITYSSRDPSFYSTAVQAVQNRCGRVGAYLAALLLEWIGIGSFLVPAGFFFLSAGIYKREGGLRVLATSGGMTLAVLGLTVFASIQWNTFPYGEAVLLTGGALGIWFSQILIEQFNPFGASIVSFTVFLMALAISTPLSVALMGAKICGSIWWFFRRVVFKVLQVTTTSLVLLMGLLAMKTAHGILKRLESAIQMFREAYDEWSDERKEAEKLRALTAKSNIPPPKEDVKNPLVASSPVETVPVDSANRVELLPVSSLKPAEKANDVLAKQKFEEKSEEKLAAIEALSSAIPEILPHDKKGQLELTPLEPSSSKKKKPRVSTQWKLPKEEFLVVPPKVQSQVDKAKLYQNAELLRQKFLDFEIEGQVEAVRPGPVITLYEFKPAPGVKVSRIAALADDISMALSAQSVRIIAPLPGRSVVGIEIPSDDRENVFLKEFIQHQEFKTQKHVLPVAMGKDIAGNVVFSDLAKMPHLLCAGQTGAGKSVFMNTLICSLLYRFGPDELRMILVDPKMIEFSSYQDVPHLLLPVVDDSSKASAALKWAVREMERRYRVLSMMNVRNLAAFNQRVEELGEDLLEETLEQAESQVEGMERLSGGDWVEAFEKDEGGEARLGKLPYIVIVIDELADLMMTSRKEVELSIARIAQKARAAGIHLVIATQRPSTDVITGVIKANLPSRVSFQLASGVDSKTILDRVGAERLLGRGDMFFIPPGTSQLVRLHGAFLSDGEINEITAHLKKQGKPKYRNEILQEEGENEEEDGNQAMDNDELFVEAIELVKKSGHASASYLQRHLRVGYNRAARMIETMEERGIVGPADGARPREVLLRER